MVRMFQYFERYCTLSQEAQDFLACYGRVVSYRKKGIYIFPGEVKHNWCFILEGLVGVEQSDLSGACAIEQVLAAHDYFSGSKHPYSLNSDQVLIRLYKHSVFYELSHVHFQKALRDFREMQQLYHILKQQQLDKVKYFMRAGKVSRVERIAYLHTHFPLIAPRLTVEQTCLLLGFTSSRQYYEALDYYFRHG